jgi:hypothetical protein
MFHVSLAAGPAILAVLVGAEGRPAKCALPCRAPFLQGEMAASRRNRVLSRARKSTLSKYSGRREARTRQCREAFRDQ